jgi:hypothetical protein
LLHLVDNMNEFCDIRSRISDWYCKQRLASMKTLLSGKNYQLQTPKKTKQPKLLNQVCEALLWRNCGLRTRTEQTYCKWEPSFVHFYGIDY